MKPIALSFLVLISAELGWMIHQGQSLRAAAETQAAALQSNGTKIDLLSAAQASIRDQLAKSEQARASEATHGGMIASYSISNTDAASVVDRMDKLCNDGIEIVSVQKSREDGEDKYTVVWRFWKKKEQSR